MLKIGGGGNKLSILFICTTLIFASLFCAVWHREGYTSKVKQAVGITEYVRDDWRTISGWNKSLKEAKVDADIVFFGDSITNRGNFSCIDETQVIMTMAIPGESLKGMRSRVDMLETVCPEKIFIMGGINGITDGCDKIVQEYQQLINSIRETVPEAQIYIQSILPVNEIKQKKIDNFSIIDANKKIELMCKEYKIVYIDLFSLYYDKKSGLAEKVSEDGLHLNQDNGYDRWYQEARKYVQKN